MVPFNVLLTLMSMKVFSQPFPDNVKIGERINNQEVSYCYPVIAFFVILTKNTSLVYWTWQKKKIKIRFYAELLHQCQDHLHYASFSITISPSNFVIR